ncbi:MAG: IS3 family transposase [Pirellulaceae bacterium]|nr:IS3 family transposase [Pirellulaceae bacterium]
MAALCRVRQVSRSGLYKSMTAEPSKRKQRRAKIGAAVQHIFEDSNGIYGSRKIAKHMQADDQLENACRNTVAKAMQDLNLKSKVSGKFKPTTTVADPTKKPADNLLDQVFTVEQPDRHWVADIAYLPTRCGWVYLAVVLDLFSRKVVGWSIQDCLATPLVSEALRQAVESRRPDCSRLLHHSDRGCQYTSDAFQGILCTLGITCSMSRTGCCYDNAVMERFFWSLKHEWTYHESYADLEEARLGIFKYIETFYNTTRLHQTLGYQSPNQFEAEYQLQTVS